MSPEVQHNNAEQSTKRWLNNQYTSHRTAVDSYQPYEGVKYEKEVARLGKNILQYVVKERGEQGARYYVNTTGLDWQ